MISIQDLISIIVPVYNTEKYLDQCIQSVLAQTYTNWELLLIDDGSTDSSGAICDKYAAVDKRIRVFHKENGGVSSARNLGLDNAKGEWITFVDSDDWVEPAMYFEMLEGACLQNSDIVYCDIRMVFTNCTTIHHVAAYDIDKKRFINNFIASKWTSLCNILVKRTLFEKHGIRHPVKIAFCEDFDVSLRLMIVAQKISHIAKPLYNYNQTNQSSALHNISPLYYRDERIVNIGLIKFAQTKGFYKDIAKNLCWRLLKSEQEYILDRTMHNLFLITHPDSHNYIWSCPYINKKMKIMMWAIAHRLGFIAKFILYAREVKQKAAEMLGGHNIIQK